MSQHIKYLWYVIRHKWFVFVAGLRVGAPILQLLVHDWSKFLPSEWLPYASFFYGREPIPSYGDARNHPSSLSPAQCENIIRKRSAKFDAAWNHHQKRNKHHWQYWVLLRDDGTIEPLDMPECYIREMVADWCGAGRAITGRWEVSEWYAKNKHKMNLSDSTRARVELLLP